MQVQSQSMCEYYPSNGSPYSPVGNASLGTDSNNSSPESVHHAEYRPFAPQHQQHQQRNHQLMDLSSPLSTHPRHHYQQQVQANRQQHQHVQSAWFQNNRIVSDQYYEQQELETYDSGLMNGSYVSDQMKSRYSYPQQPPPPPPRPQQQQQQQQHPINRYAGGNTAYSSPPAVTFAQQQQHHHQQMYAQPQLSPSEQYAIANTQLPQHQTYSQQPTFPFPESVNYVPSVAVAKQRVAKVKTINNNNNNKRKRKPSDDDDVIAAIKMPKLEEPTIGDGGCLEDYDDQRLTASKRERQRTQELNKAYSHLRQTIPCLPSDKLSKIQTVRLATKYIEFLFRVLQFSALPEAMRHAHASPKTAALAAARDVAESTKMSPNGVPSHEKLSYAFSVWRMGNEMTGTTRIE